MAGYGGYFLKGLGQGISQGMQWGTNILNIQAQKKARDDAEKLKEKISLQSQELMGMINEYGTQYTDEEASHIRTFANASVAEVQAQFKPYLDDIETGRLKQAEIKRKEISEYYDYIWTLNLTPGQVTQTLDNFKKNYTSEGALNFLKAEERMLKAKTEAREMQPAAAKEPTISDYGTGLKYLTNIANLSPENWETARKALERTFGFDYSKITRESLIEPISPATTKTPTPTSFKTIQDIKDSFKHVKTKTEYDSAVASYNTSKEAKASEWTPPSFEKQLVSYIKEVEEAFWADFVNKGSGKLKNKNEAETYNKNLQNYLKLIEEAKNAGIDVSQFQAFISYGSSGFLGLGDMSVIKESW